MEFEEDINEKRADANLSMIDRLIKTTDSENRRQLNSKYLLMKATDLNTKQKLAHYRTPDYCLLT